MEQIRMLSRVLLLWYYLGNQPAIALGISVTRRDEYFAGHVFSTLHRTDWLSCTMACQEQHLCVSYNYNTRNGACELSNHGIREACDSNKVLVSAQGFIFHQLRQVPESLAARGIVQVSQCDCSCHGESACVTPGPEIALSCKDIWEHTRNRSNGPRYIQGSSSKHYVYCHMTEIPGCGGGGWTLVMKIDGSKNTFTYKSNWWTNKESYNERSGRDLAKEETKMATYWTTPFKSLCLGMEHNGHTKWIKVNYKATNLFDVISTNQHAKTKVPLNKWKSLLKDSSMQTACVMNGFNCNNSALARIGIIGFGTCKSTSHSRIGFGTAGGFFGMNDTNSCGNEARNGADNGDRSITAFGFIFVK